MTFFLLYITPPTIFTFKQSMPNFRLKNALGKIFPAILALTCFSFSTVFSQTSERYWIYFRDKGTEANRLLLKSGDVKALAQSLGISSRTLQRRAKVLPHDRLIDESDLPVSEKYIQALRDAGTKIEAVSRWLNAVSVEVSPQQLQTISSFPFVDYIAPVRALVSPGPQPSSAPVIPLLRKSERTGSLDYGPSYTQLATERITDLHALGIVGKGIVVGIIDDGFNNHRTHVALKNIHVLAEHDFIHNITDTQHQSWEDPSQGNHGAGVLSSVAGFDPGHIIGGAYGISVILAKTEMDSSGNADFSSEEDTYVAGLEWIESLGADIATSSLAYKEFNPPDTSYSYSSLNGRTTVVAKAASIAARKGMLLCTAMGNEGFQYKDSTAGTMVHELGTLWSPADADSILAVGATLSDGELATFSGTGPTSDGRIKPDIVAQGTSIYWANGATTDGYYYVQGTSCSTPITASAAALVLSAHPQLAPMQVRQAILQTAVQYDDGTSQTAAYPNNLYGYGFVDALSAALADGPVFSNVPVVSKSAGSVTISTPIKSSSKLLFDSLRVYFKRPRDVSFQSVRFIPSPASADGYIAAISTNLVDSTTLCYFFARDSAGRIQKQPYNAPDSLLKLFTLPSPPEPVLSSLGLLQNFPNPFNQTTQFSYALAVASHMKLEIFDLLGRKIATVVDNDQPPGIYITPPFNAASLASGIYVYRLTGAGGSAVRKMVVIK
ncbi:MAG: S8 family peptidase [Bacteroidota bacterium]|nr:S8 family peptidase [Bacteroidota bacterium]